MLLTGELKVNTLVFGHISVFIHLLDAREVLGHHPGSYADGTLVYFLVRGLLELCLKTHFLLYK